MDRTSITVGSSTREALREYKKANGHRNYNRAVQSLLEESTTD